MGGHRHKSKSEKYPENSSFTPSSEDKSIPLQRHSHRNNLLSHSTILHLQKTRGNQYVQRLLNVDSKPVRSQTKAIQRDFDWTDSKLENFKIAGYDDVTGDLIDIKVNTGGSFGSYRKILGELRRYQMVKEKSGPDARGLISILRDIELWSLNQLNSYPNENRNKAVSVLIIDTRNEIQRLQRMYDQHGSGFNPIDGFPTVLGYVSPRIDYTLPDINIIDNNGSFNFQQTSAQAPSDPKPALLPQGNHYLGNASIYPGNGEVFVDAGPNNYTFRNVTTTCSEGGNYQVYIELDSSKFQELKTMEQEHIDDFAHGFNISGQEIATQINALAGNSYTNSVEAMQALIPNLPQKLIPQEPMDFGSWQTHLKGVLADLFEFSKDRDRGSPPEHSPAGYTLVCDPLSRKATLSPIFRHINTPSNQIVGLGDNRLPIAYDGHPLIDIASLVVPNPGDTVFTTASEKVQVYSAPTTDASLEGYDSFNFNGDTETIPENILCEVVSQVDGVSGVPKVWVKVTREQCEIDSNYWDYNEGLTHVYFMMPVTSLW
jgi:hypothetical protein